MIPIKDTTEEDIDSDITAYIPFSIDFFRGKNLDMPTYLITISRIAPSLQHILKSEQTSVLIDNDLGMKFQLSGEQKIAIARIIRDIIIATMPLSALVASLEQKLGIDTTTAQKIAEDILTHLFSPEALAELEKIHRTKPPIEKSVPEISLPKTNTQLNDQNQGILKTTASATQPETENPITQGNTINLRNP